MQEVNPVKVSLSAALALVVLCLTSCGLFDLSLPHRIPKGDPKWNGLAPGDVFVSGRYISSGVYSPKRGWRLYDPWSNVTAPSSSIKKGEMFVVEYLREHETMSHTSSSMVFADGAGGHLLVPGASIMIGPDTWFSETRLAQIGLYRMHSKNPQTNKPQPASGGESSNKSRSASP